MNRNFTDLSFEYVLDLYHTKLKAEARDDLTALCELKKFYPELFSKEMNIILSGIQIALEDFLSRYTDSISHIIQKPVKNTLN